MTYQVLARRWRPQKFEDVIGQDHVVRTLQNAITGDRLAHAYLFTGVRGVGKTSVARIFAKALNCEKGPTPTPDNDCPICNEITSGSSVDVLEIDGASNTGVDDVRELRENVRYMPQGARYKIYIIDEVHMLSNAAFNALLKTLEEPPPHVIFIFATTEPHKIPQTILSRCQRFDFRRISRDGLLTGLKTICNDEGVKINDSDLKLIVREAEGSMRDALSLLDQAISYAGKDVPQGEVSRALGIADRAWISEMADALVARDAKKALAVVDRGHDYGYDLREMLRDLVAHLRNMAVARVVSDPDGLIDLPREEVRAIVEQAGRLEPEEIQVMFSILSRAEDQMGRAPDPKLVLEMSLIQAVQATPAAPVDEAIQRLELLEKRLASEESPRFTPPSTPSSKGSERTLFDSAPKAGPQKTSSFTWQGLLDMAHHKKAHVLCSILETVRFDRFEDGTLTLEAIHGSFEEKQLKDKDVQKQIEGFVQALAGGHPRLKVISRTPALKSPEGGETGRDRALKKEARENPRVKDMEEIFGATVQDVRSLQPGEETPEEDS